MNPKSNQKKKCYKKEKIDCDLGLSFLSFSSSSFFLSWMIKSLKCSESLKEVAQDEKSVGFPGALPRARPLGPASGPQPEAKLCGPSRRGRRGRRQGGRRRRCR